MMGIVLWAAPEKGRRTVELSVMNAAGVRFVCAQVVRGARTPEALVRRRVSAAGRGLAGRGVKQAVAPPDFPYMDRLARWGVAPVSTLALRRRLAAEWVRCALEEQGMAPASARVAVCAAAVTGEVVRTVTELALRRRYVLLSMPGGEALARQLRREYGVALLLEPTAEQLEAAEGLVLFDPRPDLTCGNPAVVPLYREDLPLPEILLPPALEAQLPRGADRGTLLAALYQAGAVKAGEMSLSRASRLTF